MSRRRRRSGGSLGNKGWTFGWSHCVVGWLTLTGFLFVFGFLVYIHLDIWSHFHFDI